MKQFKIAVKNYGVSFSKEGNDFTVIDSKGNSWTSFPYHLKVKAKPGETIYFQTKQRTQHAVPGRGTGWKFEQISERAYNLKTDRSIPAPEKDRASAEQKDLRNFIHDSYKLKPKTLKMSEIKWKYLVRSAVRGKNIMMTGPAGCGKTLAAKSLVQALDRPDFYFNLGATQDPRSTLVGNVHFDKETGTFFSESQFVKAIQTENAVILLDELTRAHPDAWNILMSVLDSTQRYMRLDETSDQKEIKVANGVTFIATANIGAAYTATRVLDKAMLDRFAVIEMDTLSKEDETDLLTMLFPKGDSQILSNIAEIAFMTRVEAGTDNPRIEHGVSTRTSVEMASLVYDGFSLGEVADITVYPQYDTSGGVDSERTFVKQIVQKFLGESTEEELFTAEEMDEADARI